MTEAERKKRGDKSAVIVERLVRVQLRAMGCERFDIGIKRDAGEMILREGHGAPEIEATIKWLRHENAKGAHIYVRPAGLHGLSLIDDLTAEAIERMKAEGFEPAVVVETSLNNFQAWLNHGQVLEAPMSTRAAKALVERFGGDPSSADWRHFGPAGWVHQFKAGAAAALGDAAVRKIAVGDRARLLESGRVSCGHPNERRPTEDADRAAESGPT